MPSSSPANPSASSPAAATAGQRPPRTVSAGRKWLFRLIAVGIGLLALCSIEGLLRLVGAGRDLSLMIDVPAAPGWKQFNPAFDLAFFGLTDLSGPEAKPFRMPKPKQLRRIVVVGGSTVAGFPYPPELVFARVLEHQLQAQAGEEFTVEVLNAGITALNSNSEVMVVEEALRGCDPDLIVVYTGHNEFYGPGGIASHFGQLPADAFRSAARWRRLRSLQVLNDLLSRSPSETPDLLEALPTSLNIMLNSAPYQATVARLRENLGEMIRFCTEARVPLLLVAPASNLRDQPPIQAWTPPSSSSPAGSWEQSFHQALELLNQPQTPELRSQVRQALEATLRSGGHHQPVACFLLAQELLAAGEVASAAQRFREATDLDGARFRAPSDFGRAMQELASQQPSEQVRCFDLQAALADEDPQQIPGRELFYEHVHFTSRGNLAVGRLLARQIWSECWQKPWDAARQIDDGELKRRLGLLPEDELAALALSLQVYDKQPFKQAWKADQLRQSLTISLQNESAALPPDRQPLFDQLSLRDLSVDPAEALLRLGSPSGSPDRLSEEILTAAVRRQPWSVARRQLLLDRYQVAGKGNAAEIERLRKEAARWPHAELLGSSADQ